MSGSPRSNNGSSVTSPSCPTASPVADNSHLQQQQYQQQPMYGMPPNNQSVHTTATAASSAAAAATAASAATTAATAVAGSSNQPGQQSNFVPTGPYQYQGAYQPTNLQQRVDAAALSLNQMFPTWSYLQGAYMAKDTVNQSKISTQLSNIQMINGEKVTYYINCARNLRDQLQNCGGYFPDAMFHTVLLAGLGPVWRQCRSILRMQATLSEGALCAALIAEQQDMDLHNA
ncbi:unnamed protein product [Closterium sp. NIES-54]